MNNKRRTFRVTFTVSAILLAAIAFFLISVLDNLPGARVDMTSDKLFTMSPAASKILKGLQVPVQVKLYVTPSDKMPTQLRNLERDITEQMRNFEQVSEGMLEYQVFNPQNDEEMQKTLGAKGIRPFQIQSIEKDEMGIKLVWSAITIAYKDKPEEILPQVLPQNLAALEQDIISPIYRLTRDKAPKVAVYGPKKQVDQQLAMMYLQQGMQPPEPAEQYAQLSELMKQGHYEAVPIELTEASPVPDDIDALVVMAIAPLNERQVFEINRTLRRGVPVVMGVQAHEYGYSPAQSGGWTISGQALETGLEPMLAEFGLTVSEDHFMDTSMETIDLPREVNLGGLRMQTREPVQLPIQIRVTEVQMDQDSPLVNRIGAIFYLWGTPIISDPEKLTGHSLKVTELIHGSDNSWTEPWSEGPVTMGMLSPERKTMSKAQPLAVLVEGVFPDTYQDQEIPPWQTAAADGDPLSQVQAVPEPVDPAPGSLFLIGCAKMFDDNILAAGQNALLLLNAVDFLAGSQDLLDIRSKTLTQRVIKPVEARDKMIWRIVCVLLVPVIIAIFGFVRAALRRKEAARYRETIKHATGALG
jgi:ABC-2 type transport system permease protein